MRYLTVFLALLTTHCWAEEAPHSAEILDYANTHLCHNGELKQMDNGFVYLDVDDDYIHQLIPLIQNEGFQEPPYFGPDFDGAHITVVYAAEAEAYAIGKVHECGKKISFVPIACQIVHPPKWPTVDAVYLISVDAPELDRLRRQYGLPKSESSFHITIGVKPKVPLPQGSIVD